MGTLVASARIFKEAGLKPRPGQVEAAEGVAKALDEGLSVVFVAPTGFGKTLAVLAGLKASQHLPALWLIRSLEIGRRISGDALLLGLRPFVAAGRARTCPLAEKLGEAIHEWCKTNRAKCRYYLDLLRRGIDVSAALSWQDLLGSGVCPYYAQDLAAKEADIVIQSYYRRPYPASAAVVDEAHNLLAPRVRRLSVKVFAEAAAELRALGRIDLAEEALRLASTSKHVPLERLPLLELEDAVREALERLKAVRGLIRLTRAVRTCQKGGAAYRESWSDVVEVYEPPWRPQTRPVVYVSATMPEGLEGLLGAEATIRVPPQRRLGAYVTSWLTTRFGEETWRGYAKLLTVLKFRFRKVLAFATERVAIHLLSSVDLYEPELDRPPRDWKGVLLLHIRGRFAEGVDLPADCVIVLGCPFLPPEVTRRLRRFYERAGCSDAAFWAPMVIVTLQAVGRATRSPEHEPVIVLADERFQRYADKFHPHLELIEISSPNHIKGRRHA